jgi:RNA polymerase sigma-70 factor (ECF subfamily)
MRLLQGDEEERQARRPGDERDREELVGHGATAAQSDDLYRGHAPRALALARRMLRDESEAEEVVHDVFLSLIERPDQFSGKSGFGTFLHGAVTHACLKRLRSRNTRQRLLRDGIEHTLPQAVLGVLPEEAATLLRTLQRLPPGLADVAVYYHMHECSRDDIALLMRCSRRHVGNLINRLAERVRRLDDVE